ncbi:MAG: hypothetical protein IPP68_03910 [Elusimicrobia bacterium]|nr:hypothetical protein [Elusimicrobiota bacterium]
MRLNSAEIQSQSKRLFVQESRPPLDLTDVEKTLTSIGTGLGEAKGQFAKAEKDYANAGVAARGMLTNLTKATGQTDALSFKEPGDMKSLRDEGKALSAMSVQIDRDMNAGNYQEAADLLQQFNQRTEIFKAKSEGMAAAAEMVKGFFREIREVNQYLGGMGNAVDMGEVAKKGARSSAEIAKGYERYPAIEKVKFSVKATFAQETLINLVEAKAIEPEQGLDWAMALKLAKDQVFAAGPSQLGDRLKVSASRPQETISLAANEAADLYLFDFLSSKVETAPGTIGAIAQIGYGLAKSANIVGKAAGVGLAATFPVSSLIAIGTSFSVDQTLQAVGYNDDLSGFGGMVAGATTGIAVGNFTRVALLERAWAMRIGATNSVGQLSRDFFDGAQDTFLWTLRTIESEAGHVATSGAIQKMPAVAKFWSSGKNLFQRIIGRKGVSASVRQLEFDFVSQMPHTRGESGAVIGRGRSIKMYFESGHSGVGEYRLGWIDVQDSLGIEANKIINIYRLNRVTKMGLSVKDVSPSVEMRGYYLNAERIHLQRIDWFRRGGMWRPRGKLDL